MQMKYIITDKNAFAIFSDTQSHTDMARGMWGEPVGAGFCTIQAEADSSRANVHCFGKSTTLHLESRPEDENIINYKINNPYE